MITRNEIIEMLMATVSESHSHDHFDVRAIAEGFTDQLMLINDEHHRQIAQAKAMFDEAVKREMAFVNSNLEGALKRLFDGLQGGLSESCEFIDRVKFATRLAQAKEQFDREIAALRQELVQANQLATLRAIDRFDRLGRGANDSLN
jgi:hypothetical protein